MANKFISTLAASLSVATVALTGLYASAVKAESFSNSAISFDKDTYVEFEFLESHGSYKATFGVIDLSSGSKTPLIKEDKPADSDDRDVNKASDFLGTPGNTVSQPKNGFLFKANTPYTLYLESKTASGRVASIVYSNNTRNPRGSQQVMLDKGFEGLSQQGVKINWDDRAKDGIKIAEDFNDFIVIAGGGSGCACDKGPTDTAPVTPDPDADPGNVTPRTTPGRRGRG